MKVILEGNINNSNRKTELEIICRPEFISGFIKITRKNGNEIIENYIKAETITQMIVISSEES